MSIRSLHRFTLGYLVALFSLLPPLATARAATLDTPPLAVAEGSSNVVCSIVNLHATKTLQVASTTCLVYSDGGRTGCQPGDPPTAVAPGQGLFVVAIDVSVNDATPVHCHFDFTGVPKAKVRAALNSSPGGSLSAY